MLRRFPANCDCDWWLLIYLQLIGGPSHAHINISSSRGINIWDTYRIKGNQCKSLQWLVCVWEMGREEVWSLLPKTERWFMMLHIKDDTDSIRHNSLLQTALHKTIHKNQSTLMWSWRGNFVHQQKGTSRLLNIIKLSVRFANWWHLIHGKLFPSVHGKTAKSCTLTFCVNALVTIVRLKDHKLIIIKKKQTITQSCQKPS